MVMKMYSLSEAAAKLKRTASYLSIVANRLGVGIRNGNNRLLALSDADLSAIAAGCKPEGNPDMHDPAKVAAVSRKGGKARGLQRRRKSKPRK